MERSTPPKGFDANGISIGTANNAEVDDQEGLVDSIDSHDTMVEERIILMATVDAKVPSPECRAAFIFDHLQATLVGATNWDLFCFSVEYLGRQIATFPMIERLVKSLVMFLYTAHYYDAGTDFLKDDATAVTKEFHKSWLAQEAQSQVTKAVE